jgi:hypothetical protein
MQGPLRSHLETELRGRSRQSKNGFEICLDIKQVDRPGLAPPLLWPIVTTYDARNKRFFDVTGRLRQKPGANLEHADARALPVEVVSGRTC